MLRWRRGECSAGVREAACRDNERDENDECDVTIFKPSF